MNFSESRPAQRAAALPPESAASAASPFLRELFGILSRRRAVILLMIIMSLLGAVAFLATTPPRYTATVTMVLDTKRLAPVQSEQSPEGPVDQAAIASQVETIKSEKVTSQVIKKFDLVHDPEFMPSPPGLLKRLASYLDYFSSPEQKTNDDPEAAAMRAATRILNSGLKVTHLPRTYTVEVSVTSFNKEKAMKIANEVAEAYITDQLEAKYEVMRRSGAWLQQRIEELRQQASEAFKAVQDFKTSHNIIVDSAGKLSTDREVDELTDALGRARTEVSTAEARLQRIQNILAEGTVAGTTDPAVPDVINNPVIVRLRDQYLDAQKREAEWARRFGKDHLAAVNQRNEKAALANSILSEVQRIAETYKSQVEIARSTEHSIETRLKEVFQRSASTRQSQVRLRELETQATTYQTIFETFLNRYTQAVQQQSFPSTEARVITAASLPDWKSFPKTPLTLFLALLGGATLGVAAAAAQEHLDRVVRTRRQIEALGLDCLAILPDVGKRHSEERQLVLINDEDPFSAAAESLRAVKVAIDINQIHKKSIVIGVVSGFSGDGKSTFATSLAELIGKAGGKILLVDGDLRNPTLTSAFIRGRQPGLIEVMLGARPLEACVSRSASRNFDFLSSTLHARLVYTAELLRSPGMSNMLEAARSRYEYIIVDLPPLLLSPDVRGAAHLFDSFIYVAHWGHTTVDDVKNALGESLTLSERLLGVVLNKADLKTMRRFEGYGRPGAGYYYGYGGDKTPSKSAAETIVAGG